MKRFYNLSFTLIIVLSSALTQNLFAQNLIPNPSFETAGWAQANSGSADWLTGPTNVFGAENARTGTRYMGESMGRSPAGGATDFREYIKNSFTTPLIPGNTYECSIWVSLSENYGTYACNSIGFVTTIANPFYAFSNAPIPLTPVYATPSVITNKTGWTQVFGTFVATSADAWVIIGNFNTQAATTWQYVGPASSFYYGYYFMDDACLGPPGACGIVLPVELLAFNGKAENRKVELDWKTASELQCNYFVVERSTNGKTFEEVGRVNGNGTSQTEHNYAFTDNAPVYGKTSYYRLHQFDKNGQSHYSTMVAIEPKGEMNVYINVYPVPANNELNIELNSDNKVCNLIIMNSAGIVIYNQDFDCYQNIKLNNLAVGNYIAVLNTSEGKTISRKFMVIE